MHGRPRPPVGEPENPEKKKAGQKRLALFSRLCNVVLERRAAKRYDAESITLAAKLLEQNPEVYTVWNYRREALEDTFKGGQGLEKAMKAIEFELKLTESALRKNPKSYATWHHRKWLVDQGLVPLDRELQLLNGLQEMDSRNFHAWRYRRIVTAKAGIPAEQEERYTMSLINVNFSDYSAWHARTVLLPQMHAADSGPMKEQGSAQQEVMPSSVIEQELDLVEQATFTDPSDQSAWIYHRWLLSQALQRYQEAEPQMQSTAHQELCDLLEREVGRCEGLLEAEADRSKCKWPILTMARLLELRDSLHAQQGAGDSKVDGAGESGERLKELYTELIEIDPLRKGYYRDALAGSATVLVQPGP